MESQPYTLIERIGDDRILAIVRATFGSGADLVRCTPICSGFFNTAYRVKTVNPELEAILRIAPPSDRPLFSYERTMMAAEPMICDMIRDAGVPVPRVLAYDGSESVIDRSFIFIEYVDSVPMNHESVPAEAKPMLMRELGECAARIHQIQGSRFGWPTPEGGVRGGEKWSDVFSGYVDELCTRLVAVDAMGGEEASTLMRGLVAQADVFDECKQPVLVHNDLWEPNLLVARQDDGFRLAAIIDADRAMFADREYEYILWDPNPDFMEGYGILLDSSPQAILRRKYYRLSFAMFQTWFHRVQMWWDGGYEQSRAEQSRLLLEISA